MNPPEPTASHPAPTASRSPVASYIASALLLLAAGAIVTWSLVRAAKYPSVNVTETVLEFATPTELAAHLHDVVGTFATGNQPGDRVIVVGADRRVTFQIIGPLKAPLTLTDTFRLGKRDDHADIVTLHSGVIAQDDIDHLTYCGDSYERTK